QSCTLSNLRLVYSLIFIEYKLDFAKVENLPKIFNMTKTYKNRYTNLNLMRFVIVSIHIKGK
ncbi:hypothetical protein BSK16_08590, partial [Streptococcus pneumoniae]|nr:hypothetical protein [Streptococcus pneumoniae]